MNMGNYQSYLSPSGSYCMNPDEAHDWEKLAWIHQGQIILDKPDCVLAHSNLLCVYGTSGRHCLPGFQVFPCCFPHPLPRETNILCSRRGICVLAGNWLMDSTQSRVGNAPSQTGCLSQVGSPGTGIGPLFNTIMSGLDGGIWCALMDFADGIKLSGEVNLQKGEPSWKKSWMGWKNGLIKSLTRFSKD